MARNFHIAVGPELGRFIQKAVKDGQYSSPGEYFRDLVRKEYRRETDSAELERQLLMGLEGTPVPWNAQTKAKMKAELDRFIAVKNGGSLRKKRR